MPDEHRTAPGADSWALAESLAPLLREACGGRLSEIRWFRADWQRGGAGTGYAQFTPGDGERWAGQTLDVVVKVPVGPVEHRFTTALAETEAPTPRVVAHGEWVGGYDLAWVVMERLPGDPLSGALHEEVFSQLAEAAALFALHAKSVAPATRPKPLFDWPTLLDKGRETLRVNEFPEGQRWKNALKSAQRALPALMHRWESRTITGWCHGDLHPGNAMRRPEGSAFGPARCVLLDMAEVHPGHWVEDGVYLERLFWARPEALHGAKPVKLLARARRAAGLETGDDYGDLANIRRVLMAACAPAFAGHDGHPKYLHAALEALERLLPQVGG